MNIKYILFFVSLITLFSSCSKDSDPVLPNYSASVLTHPENGTLYELKQEDAAETVFSLSWTASTQNELAIGPTDYYLQVDLGNRNFDSPFTLRQIDALEDATGATQYTVDITVKELNAALTDNLGQSIDSIVDVEFRIITHIGNTLLPSTASNVFTARVIPYELSRESLFMVGNMFGVNEWNNSSSQFIMFRSAPDALDTYTGKFKAGSEFKLITAANLGTWNAFGAESNGVLSTQGGNITGIDTEGYYTLTVDLAGLSYKIESYDASKAATYNTIGLIGDFNGWSADLVLSQASYDPHIWSVDNVTLSGGGIKFRADADWAVSWGGATFPYGGGSGENIPVTDGTYYIMFNDLTGEYVFYNKN